MLQEPLCDPPRTYIAYVDQDVRLDIIYISGALDAIIGLQIVSFATVPPLIKTPATALEGTATDKI